MDLLKLLDREMRVHLSRLELGVSEHGLDHPDIGPVLVHVGGAGVASDESREHDRACDGMGRSPPKACLPQTTRTHVELGVVGFWRRIKCQNLSTDPIQIILCNR